MDVVTSSSTGRTAGSGHGHGCDGGLGENKANRKTVFSTGLPEPRMAISVDGRTFRRVNQQGTVGTLPPLPNLVNATT